MSRGRSVAGAINQTHRNQRQNQDKNLSSLSSSHPQV
tara:strand:+ start:560 stop:670 length:111 start_codon:yes stop_codon:yes gene_type:complete